jgi:membrane protease YdiL (CAAX protease family)
MKIRPVIRRASCRKRGEVETLIVVKFLEKDGVILSKDAGEDIVIRVSGKQNVATFDRNTCSHHKCQKTNNHFGEDSMIRKYALVLFFPLAYLFTWSNWLPQALSSRGIASMEVPGFLALLAGYGPALAAIIVASLAYGRQGLRALFGRLLRWRVGIWWYLIVLFLPALLTLLALTINSLTGGASPDFSAVSFPFGPPETPLWQKIIVLFLVFALGFDGLGEEIGWRGFALPKLLERYSPIISSLILGALWAIWHFPYALTRGTFLSEVPLHWFFLNLLAMSIIYTWIFINTGGSLLLPLLFHAAGNTTSNLLPILPPAAPDLRVYYFTIAINCVLAVILVLLTNKSLRSQKEPSVIPASSDTTPV